jgi:Asp-tRNA(Asn)/Glu-tRNA(Gln) amidotransferase A subunit family amidase
MAVALHTTNNVWGTAKNPYDHTRTCGGTSGGEAGIIASKCAPISIGSDTGGSIRYPSVFNGVRGFKSTADRTSAMGNRKAIKDNFSTFTHIKDVFGPLGRSVDDLVEVFKVQLNPKIQ